MKIDAPIDAYLCNVALFVAVECLISRDGKEYRGTMNRTIDGIACQPWSSTTVSQKMRETSRKEAKCIGV